MKNIPVTKKEMESLSYGYHPTLFPTRRQKRQNLKFMFNKKNSIVQKLALVIKRKDYIPRFRDRVFEDDKGNYLVIRKIYHDKNTYPRKSKFRK